MKVLDLQAFLVSFTVTTTSAKHITVPLTRVEDPHNEHALRAIARRASASSSLVIAPEVQPPGGAFWYGSFDIGASKNLSMLIDTGTLWTVLNPGVYKPGPDAVVLNETHPDVLGLNSSQWTSFYQTDKNGCGTFLARYDGYQDTVTLAGATAENQRIAISQKVKLNRTDAITELPPPYDGLVGFAIDSPALGVGFQPQKSFVEKLYLGGQIDEPRFGLAFGTSGKGKQILGGLDDSLFDGSLVQVHRDWEWAYNGGAGVTVNGAVVLHNQDLFFDSGGPQISVNGTMAHVIFEAAGMQAVETDSPCGRQVFGYYRCNAPPSIGLEIDGTNFDVEGAALKWKDDGANNCTAIISGLVGVANGLVVGNAWMQGKYIDHNSANKSMGFAMLKDPVSARG